MESPDLRISHEDSNYPLLLIVTECNRYTLASRSCHMRRTIRSLKAVSGVYCFGRSSRSRQMGSRDSIGIAS
jgi:hypothetical protein